MSESSKSACVLVAFNCQILKFTLVFTIQDVFKPAANVAPLAGYLWKITTPLLSPGHTVSAAASSPQLYKIFLV